MNEAISRRRTILVVEDDVLLSEALRDVLTDVCDNVLCAHRGDEALHQCGQCIVDVVLLDQRLPDTAGAELCESILEHNENTKIIFMSAYPSFDNAVAALKLGACDYLAKPFEIEELLLAVGNALRMLELESIEQLASYRRQKEASTAYLVGDSQRLRSVVELAEKAAAAGAPILICGETGTGKTLLAKHLHYSGPISSAPFVSVNCAALPESLAESELLGHERAAFTGAEKARRGVFEMAEEGTVLLDEIGAMALPLQAKLLGILEDREVRRLGGERARPINARIIAATNRDLEAAVAAGEFRRDLYFRLGVVPVTMPPLRERTEDLPTLCTHLLQTICGRDLSIAGAEIGRLATYPWPGNVRELKNVLERAVIVQGETELRPSRLLMASATGAKQAEPASPLGAAGLTLEELEQQYIRQVLHSHDGNLTRAAKELGIAVTTLRRKLRKAEPSRL